MDWLHGLVGRGWCGGWARLLMFILRAWMAASCTAGGKEIPKR
jgi:hypothetical protein